MFLPCGISCPYSKSYRTNSAVFKFRGFLPQDLPTARMINEIVLGEETDIGPNGEVA
jgi:hypothetical protein